MMKTGQYVASHYYWDEEDREYTLEAVWYYEDGHREIPDSLVLESLIMEDREDNAPDIDPLLVKDGNIWRQIEANGVSWDDLEYIDERDYSDYNDYREEGF